MPIYRVIADEFFDRKYKLKKSLQSTCIYRATESCKSAHIEVSDHFADDVKMVEIGSNAVRDVEDIM